MDLDPWKPYNVTLLFTIGCDYLIVVTIQEKKRLLNCWYIQFWVSHLWHKFVAMSLQADREGYIAIIMPKPTDWTKIKNSLLSQEDYKKLRDLC